MSVQSFNVVCDKHTHTLILGTMPGIASLDAFEYYAHKRNAFWPIMLAMINEVPVNFDLPTTVDYQSRLSQLLSNGVGLWDVLAECEREGSLDSAIKSGSVVANDFATLLNENAHIKTIAFNGKAAQKLFIRHVIPTLTEQDVTFTRIRMFDLPSTSPAMASLSLEQKFEKWQSAIRKPAS